MLHAFFVRIILTIMPHVALIIFGLGEVVGKETYQCMHTLPLSINSHVVLEAGCGQPFDFT